MDGRARSLKRGLVPAMLGCLALLHGAAAPAGRAAVVADGVFTMLAPEKTSVGFRLILTAEGARLAPARGETLAFSYAQKSALVLDRASKSYFMLPLELVPPLLQEGIGYDPRGLGATASGRTKTLLGFPCTEVVVSRSSPKMTLSTWRISQPAWGQEYALLERALGFPWTAANPPAVFLGLPLAGTVDVQGRRPYKASWVITKVTRDEAASEDFTIPAGYQMDMERLISVQGRSSR